MLQIIICKTSPTKSHMLRVSLLVMIFGHSFGVVTEQIDEHKDLINSEQMYICCRRLQQKILANVIRFQNRNWIQVVFNKLDRLTTLNDLIWRRGIAVTNDDSRLLKSSNWICD